MLPSFSCTTGSSSPFPAHTGVVHTLPYPWRIGAAAPGNALPLLPGPEAPLTAGRHRQHPGGQPEVRRSQKSGSQAESVSPQAAGIQKQILTQAVAGPLRQMLLRRKEGLLQRFAGPGTKLHGSSRIRGISRSLRELIEQCHIPLLRCLFQQQRPDNAFFSVFSPAGKRRTSRAATPAAKPQCGPAAHGLTSQTLRPRNFSQSSRRMWASTQMRKNIAASQRSRKTASNRERPPVSRNAAAHSRAGRSPAVRQIKAPFQSRTLPAPQSCPAASRPPCATAAAGKERSVRNIPGRVSAQNLLL